MDGLGAQSGLVDGAPAVPPRSPSARDASDAPASAGSGRACLDPGGGFGFTAERFTRFVFIFPVYHCPAVRFSLGRFVAISWLEFRSSAPCEPEI